VLFHADRAEHGDLTGWHSGGRLAYPLRLEHAGERLAGSVAMRDGGYAVTLGEQTAFMTIAGDDGQGLRYTLDGREGRAGYLRVGDDLWLDDGSGAVRITDVLMTAAGLDGGGAEDSVRAPMNGAIIAVDVKPGDAVTKGQRLAVLEAMKMEHRLVAPADGTVAEVPVAVGDQVATRAVVIRMEPPA